MSARISLTVAFFGSLPFLYVAGVGLSVLPSGELPLALAGFALLALFSLIFLFEPRWGVAIGGAGTLLLLALLCVAAISPGGPGSALDEVAWGVLLAGPILFVLHLVRTQESPGLRLVGLQLGFADGLLLLATPSVVRGNGETVESATLLRGFFTTIDTQLSGIGHLVVGRTADPPLRGIEDPWFVALAGLAVLVTFVTFLRPSTGRSVDLPTYAGPAPGAPADPDEVTALSPAFRTALDRRTAPSGAPGGQYPGAVPIAAAGVFGGALLGLAALVPAAGLVFVTGAVVALLVAVVAVLRRPLT